MPHQAATSPPPVVAESGWTPCAPFPELEGRRSFVSDGESGCRFRIAYFRRESDGHLVGRAWFGVETEGPPGHVHGGAVAAVLDEALGAVAWLSGYKVVIARLATDFRHLVPLGTDAVIDAWLHRVEGRKIFTHGRLTDESGRVLAEGHAICVLLTDEHFERFRRLRERRHSSRHDQTTT